MVKKILCILGTVITVFFVMVASIICFGIPWMFKMWDNLTIDEMIFHIVAPLEGTNEGIIKNFFDICVAPTVLITITVVILFIAYRRQKKYFIIMGFGMVGAITMSSIVVNGAWNSLDVGSYMKNQSVHSTFIDDNYIDPLNVEMTFPEKKRNLIYIFLESMEITYSNQENGGAFRDNIIPELVKIAQENEDFSGEDNKINGGYSMPGTTWTMGAMFAQTSGLPLSISISANNMDTQDSFFASTMTLGDILDRAGYSQTLMVGSDATFGGRRLYFTEHGRFDVFDYNYALENGFLPAEYGVWWGCEDQKLFDFAKEKVVELAAQDKPFNFTLLTVDTHAQDGYLCEICDSKFGDNQYANVLACSSRQVAEFVNWVQKQEFYENTTIVLVGDHPTMDSNFCANIDKNYIRKVYTAYINSPVEKVINEKRNYTTFDYFPTTLAALGVQIEGERLGLGTNLFSNKQTLSERFTLNVEKEELNKKSELMEKLANLDENKELLMREGKVSLPVADVLVDSYQYEASVLPVTVSNLSNLPEYINAVTISVYTAEDQSDLLWIVMDPLGSGDYFADINVADFNYVSGEYFIQAYVVDEKNNYYKLGENVGFVK